MYLLMQTISRWPSVKAILSSAPELNKGRAHSATQCRKLLNCQNVSAFSPQDGISVITLLDPKLYNDEDWIASQVRLNPRWDRKKEVFLRTPELVANVDVTLVGTDTKHVGVKQGGQEAEEGGGVEDKQSADDCKRKLKLAWWEQRTKWHYRHWNQFKTAFVAYWVAETQRRSNIALDDEPDDSAPSSQQAASGGTAKVGDVVGQPHPPPPPQ
jgi:hypothetical protein